MSTAVKGLTVIAGGKYTTYRMMAKDAVDAAVSQLASSLDRRVPECCTEDVPLLGADGYEALWNQRQKLAARERARHRPRSSTCSSDTAR